MYSGLLLIGAMIVIASWVSPIPVWSGKPVPEPTNSIAKPKDLLERGQSDDDLRKAIKDSELDLEVARNGRERKKEASLLARIAHFHEKLLQFPEALECYGKALSIHHRLGDSANEALISINIARIYKKRGPLENALDFYEKALDIQRNLRDTQGVTSTLLEIASVYRLLGQAWRELQCYEEVQEIRRKPREIKGEAAVLNCIAAVRMILHEDQKAQELYEAALALQQEIGDLSGQASTLNNLAQLRLNQGHYRHALALCDRGLAIQEQAKDDAISTKLLRTQGLIRQRLGQYEQALESCMKALSGSRKLGDPYDEIESLKAAALVYLAQRGHQKALDFYEQALGVVRKLGDNLAETHILQNMAEVYAKDQEFDKALQVYERVLAINKAAGVPTEGISESMVNLYLELGNTEKADQIIAENGLKGFARARLSLIKSHFDRVLSELALGREPSLEERFALATLNGIACEGRERYQDAIESFKSATDIIEQLRDSLPEADRKNLFDVKVLSLSRMAPYQGLCRVFLKMGKPYESFRYAEMTKARAFADSLIGKATVGSASADDRSGASMGVPNNIIDEDINWNKKFSELIRVQAHKKGGFDPKVVSRIRTQREAHVKKLRNMYPVFAATKYSGPMDLTETALKDDEWALEYQITESGVIIFLIEGKDIRKALFKPIQRMELDRLVRKFRETLEIDPHKDLLWPKLEAFSLEDGKRLADLLLGDILPVLPPTVPVIVVPDDFLGLLSFEMLVLNDSGKISTTNPEIPCTTDVEFFGDRNPISYYQSLTALSLMRYLRMRNNTGSRLLAFTDPIFSLNDTRVTNRAVGDQELPSAEAAPSLPFLVMSAHSMMTLNRLDVTAQLGKFLKKLDPEGTDVYDGPRATKSLLLSTDLTPYHSVVFATHGYAGTDLPGIQEPALMLTLVGQPKEQDGFLRMSEVIGLRLNAGIVALTACKTGIGKHISGEGTMFIGRAFQQAGAESVLISLWNVAPGPSIRLMQSFFQNLKSGHRRLEALRRARTEIRQAGYDHPFFWAAFILVGGTD